MPVTLMSYSIQSPSLTPTEGTPEAKAGKAKIKAYDIVVTRIEAQMDAVFFILKPRKMRVLGAKNILVRVP